MTAGVFVTGAQHLDVIVNAPGLPRIDETVVGKAVDYRFGGKGGNQAVAAKRMGAKVAMAGRVGPDQFGRQILAELDFAGVDRAQVRTVAGASGMSVAIVDDKGSYGAVIVSGVNQKTDPSDITVPDDTRVLLLQNEIPEAVNVAVASKAPENALVVLNAAPARKAAPELLQRTGLLVVNQLEAAMLTGQDDTLGDPEAALDDLFDLGPRAVLITLGARGCIGGQSRSERFAAPTHPVEVLSTHGAGDTFVGALAARMAGGDDLRSAVDFAQGAAALHVSTPVGSRATVGPEQVEGFLYRR